MQSEWSKCQPRGIDEIPGKAFPTLQTALVVVLLLIGSAPGNSQTFNLVAVAGGLTGTKSGTDYISSFGTMNALGIGTPETGLTVAQLSNGALYFSEFQVQFTGLPGGHTASLTAVVTTNFTHPAAQIVESCPSTAGCTGSAGYSAMSTNGATPSVVVASMGNATATVGIGIFLPDNDGASAFTGVDTAAVVTYTMTDLTDHKQVATATWTFNGMPNQTVQDAVQLQLTSAAGGLTVTATGGTPDYSMNFGNVNGLGIGPGTGLTTVAAAGGTIYSTAYVLNPAFTDFSSTTATITVYVSSNFANTAALNMEDASAGSGPYTAIGTSSSGQTTITTTAADRPPITRYLGLFVAQNSGAPFVGADTATLTYTITVP